MLRVHGRSILELKASMDGASAVDRARAASTILEAVLGERGDRDVSVVSADGSRDHLLVKVGNRELLRIGPADIAASGLAPEVYAETVRARLQSFLREEGRRRSVRELVLSICLVVLLGLLTLLAVRWIRDQRQDLRHWLERTVQTERGERARSMLVLSREGLEGVAYVLATLVALFAQIALVLSYVVFVLSQFALTSGWIPPLLHALLSPFGELLRRFAGFLPSVVVLVVAFYAVVGGIRVLRYFLDRVATGRLSLGWLPADLALPLRPLLEGALVLLALLIVSPLVAGSHEDLLSRLGLLAVAALLLGTLPVAATFCVGVFSVVSRRYSVGQWIEIGPHSGELTEVTFFELRLVPLGAGMIRIPHLLALVMPVRQLVGPPAMEIDLWLSAALPTAEAAATLARAVPERYGKADVQLQAIDPSAAIYRLRLPAVHLEARGELLAQIAATLASAGIAFSSLPAPDTRKR
jgi:hypothetical protein